MLFNKIIALCSGKFTEHETPFVGKIQNYFFAKYFGKYVDLPVPVAARYKAWVCGRLLACWGCGFEFHLGAWMNVCFE